MRKILAWLLLLLVAPYVRADEVTGGAVPPVSGQSGKFLSNDGNVALWQTLAGGGNMLSTNNLSDVANVTTARSNLGVQVADPDLAAISALTGTNVIYYRSAADVWTPVTIGSNLTFTAGTLSASSSGAAWGTITGTLSSQTDLQTALNAKLATTGSGASLTGITFSQLSGTATDAQIPSTITRDSEAAAAYQPLDADLTALAALSGTSEIYYRSAANTWTPVSIGTNLTFTGGTLSATGGGGAVWGSITGFISSQADLQTELISKQPVDADLTSLSGASSTNTIYYRSIANTWSPVIIGANLTFSGGTLAATGGGGVAWGGISGTLSSQADLQSALNAKQALDADLTSLSSASGTNTLYYRSAADTWSAVTIGSNLTFTGGTLAATTSGGGTWGSITGTLSSQTDLQAALDGKLGPTGSASALTVTASGFNGNLTTADDTVQEIAQKFDDFTSGFSVPGADTQILFNDGGSMGADADLTWNKSTNTLTFSNMFTTSLTAANFKILDNVNQSHGLSWVVNGDWTSNKSVTYNGEFNLNVTLTADSSITIPAGTVSLATNANPSGFDGNLATTDDTLQEIAQKFDDFVAGGAPTNATYITQTANATLSNEQALGALATGILKNTTTTGVLSIAAAGTDYSTPTSTDTMQNKDLTNANNTLPCEFIVSCSDLTTALTTGTTKAYFNAPYAFTVTSVSATVLTAPTGASIIVDINDSASTIMTTNKITIPVSTLDNSTGTAPGITDTAIAANARITIDIDQVGSTVAGAGLIVTIQGTR